MCPSGLNRHGGLLDKRGSGGRLRSHYRVIIITIEMLILCTSFALTHSGTIAINIYIYLRSVCRLDCCWKVSFCCRVSSSRSLSLSLLVRGDSSEWHSFTCYRMNVSAVVVLRVQWYQIPSCRLVISIKDLFLFWRYRESLDFNHEVWLKDSVMVYNLCPS